jgi:hypothetical protein
MRSYLTSALPLMFVLASGCWRRTELTATWREPGASTLHFNRTVTVFATTDESMRRSVEDQLVMKFPNATPSYRVVPHAADVDKGTVLQNMRDAGFDGAVVMRVTDVKEKVTYYPGSYWGPGYGFAGYWGSSWAYPYDPGYVSTSQIVSVETNIYSLKDDKLVYAAKSETTDPKNVGKLIRSVMRHIDEDLRKARMIASSPRAPSDSAAVAAGR